MMMFREVKTALVNILGDAAASRFIVVGYQRQSKASSEVKNNNRLVQVYYADGNFPRGQRNKGPHTHDLSFNVDVSASAAAKGDLSVLDSTTATQYQKAAAIASIKFAADEADTLIDELIEYVYQIIMDARNYDLGLTVGEVTNRWIERIQKDTIIERGDLIVKTANLKFTCRVQEIVLGAVGNEPPTVIFNSSTPIGDTGGAGVNQENDND
jgi:hypothetical protein